MTLVTIALGQGVPTRSPHLFLQALKLQKLLPHIVCRLRDAEDELRIKALMIIWNVMGQLPSEEASPIAVGLVQDLWPLFDGGCSRLRELSIRLFQFLLELVFGGDRRRMQSETWDLLLPLFIHMSDQSHRVAEVQTPPRPGYPTFPRVGSTPRCHLPSHPVQASWEALLDAATLLEWKELRRLLKTRQTWRVAECLVWALHPFLFPLEPLAPLCSFHMRMGKGALGLLQPMGAFCSIPFLLQLEWSRKRAQGYLDQSLRYLQDAQVPLQEAVIV
ncbi:uncharacterized protein LOC134165609 [Pezoporus occidentalis]|uniref:uncharacterized protein LOC134165609 n=1 Tax=Pezoporus occidentalis TaxID=407982 RepID=UPI002F911A00